VIRLFGVALATLLMLISPLSLVHASGPQPDCVSTGSGCIVNFSASYKDVNGVTEHVSWSVDTSTMEIMSGSSSVTVPSQASYVWCGPINPPTFPNPGPVTFYYRYTMSGMNYYISITVNSSGGYSGAQGTVDIGC